MSKGSGGTRNTGSGINRKVDIVDDGITMSQYESLTEQIGANKFDDDFQNVWSKLNDDQRYLALMEAGFSGLINDDEFEDGTFYYESDKNTIVSKITSAMINKSLYNNIDNESITVGYADGSRKYLNQYENDFAIDKITMKQGWGTSEAIAKKALNISKVSYIIYSDGFDNPIYYAKGEKGMHQLKQYGGFEQWKNGRGERRRDYIQDDWI